MEQIYFVCGIFFSSRRLETLRGTWAQMVDGPPVIGRFLVRSHTLQSKCPWGRHWTTNPDAMLSVDDCPTTLSLPAGHERVWMGKCKTCDIKLMLPLSMSPKSTTEYRLDLKSYCRRHTAAASEGRKQGKKEDLNRASSGMFCKWRMHRVIIKIIQ